MAPTSEVKMTASIDTMSPDENTAALDTAENWHHRIELRPGVITPGAQDTPALEAQIGIDTDFTGKRVLDIGARDGYFSFLAEQRGASEVVALDNVPPNLTGFDVAKRLLSSRVEYVVDNVYNLSPKTFGTFDVVFFLGVIYHLRHPLLALDRIWDVCNMGADLYVETHMIDEGLVADDGSLRNLADIGPELASFPIWQYLPNRRLGNDFTSNWAPNAVGLADVLGGTGFDVRRQWRVAFRGGATGVARALDEDDQRVVDSAREWDLVRGNVIRTDMDA
jgi:tRNA (mo5U34)-methyltransferase